MAYKKIADLKKLKNEEGFVIQEDSNGNITDVILPKDYELRSKSVIFGLLKKLEFRDESGNHFLFIN